MTEEDDILAAEHALGLADESAREASDPAFAAAVEAWRARLDPLLGPGRAPPPELWNRIQRRLPANEPGDPARPWRFATFAASAAAAVLLGILVLRPDGTAPTPAPQVATTPAAKMMVAALTPKEGSGTLTIAYDEREGRMTVTPVGMDADGRTPELWVIPADGKPRSLGVIAAKDARTMIVAGGHRPLLASGVTLAVSLEPEGGSPTGQPTGPVVMTGTMTIV
ncbi:anti-sigma factor [Sphingomonas sp.]|jgi:anti-sigma-K factor RskA|uniref:anti-sigma factor n=1 Tax=Sphingomonas sp. TaxID=28214 RepID=UPI002DEE69F6|nr:anti-sigma factor [Sphingomonas sp.]HEV2570000.1 anti-sigma factor [Sphingomonas sp.]